MKCDFAIEAALLSKEMGGAPVKVVWTREDDIRHGFYHTVTAERFEAGIDAGSDRRRRRVQHGCMCRGHRWAAPWTWWPGS